MRKARVRAVSARSDRLPGSSLTAAVVATLYPGLHAWAQQEERRPMLEEIVVTATRREASLQDVPHSITAFTTADIERQAFRNMEDYVKALPSLALVNSLPGRNSLVMRGIATGSQEFRTDSQVAVYLDEQPMTTNSQQVDVRLVDIERLEVLPGPQGTLFGSASQTGTLRIITNKPSFDGFSGQMDASVLTTKDGEESYDLTGHLNVPVVDDKLALRLVGFYAHEGGYVDNVLGATFEGSRDNAAVVEEDFNDYDTYGGRIAAQWRVSRNWSALVSMIGQASEADGSWDTDPALGDFKITRFFDEYREDDWWQASVTTTGDLGFASLTANVSYFDREIAYEFDNMTYEQFKDSFWGVYYGYGLFNTEYTFGTTFNDQHQDRLSAEIRLTSQGDSRLRWLAGLFFEDVYDEWLYGTKNPDLMSTIGWATANAYAYYARYTGGYDVQYPLPPTEIGYANKFKRTVKQIAVYGEVDFDLTDAWTVTGGARWFQYDREEFDNWQFPQGLPPFGSIGTGGTYTADGKSDDVLFKFSTQYRFDPDRMVYFTFSQGFRLGGSNSQRAASTGIVPLDFDPDKLNNYELGLKSEWFDDTLLLNVALFYMKWDDIQLDNGGGIADQWWLRGTINGGDAETTGAEINATWRATENLLLQLSVFLADPEFPDEFSLATGEVIPAGTPMPLSPESKYWAAIEYTVPNAFGLNGNLWFRLDASYQDAVFNTLESARTNNRGGLVPSYSIGNAQVGVSLTNGWEVSLIVRNVWDEKAVNSLYNDGNYEAQWFGDPRYQNLRTYQRPRSVGLSFRKRFE
jgi:outer membrane receptor protein involved in Fe transport